MSDVIKKMYHKFPKALMGNYVLLSAKMAKPAVHGGSTIQAVFFLSFWCVRQNKIFLKIRTNMLEKDGFSLTNNSITFATINIFP
jgi:hypothetical protein